MLGRIVAMRRDSVGLEARYAGAVFALTFVGFLGSLRGGFVWDDWALVAGTQGFRGFDARHLLWMFTTRHMGNFCPLAWLSYAVDYAVWGLNPLGYHLTNVVLHSANAALFFLLAARLLKAAFPERARSELALGACAAALAFALHPLRVESVAWISERRDVLAGFFCLLTVLGHVRAVELPPGRARRRLRLLSVAAYAGAALSKATVVPLPAALLILDYYPLRRWSSSASFKKTGALLVEKWPYFVLSAAAAALAVRAQALAGNFVAVSAHGPASRLAQALFGAGFYLAKTAVPAGLSALYPLPEHLSPLDPRVLASAAVVVLAALALRLAGVERRARLALWSYYAVFLLPVSGLLQNGPQLAALRYSYLLCLGWALLAGAALLGAGRGARFRAVAAGLAVWLAVDAAAAQRQFAVWRDETALWTDVLSRFPESREAGGNLIASLLRAQDYAGAEAAARNLLQLYPDDARARLAIARAQVAKNRLGEARDLLENILAANPDLSDAHSLLGLVAARQGRVEDAVAHLRRAAELEPGSASAWSNAGAALASAGRFDEAARCFEEAARLDPGNPDSARRLEQARRDAAAR
jgi:Flp pilus assembly protein TadD